MSNKKKVIPKPGMVIPTADGNGNLPAEGKVVTMNSYYWGLKHDGDVTLEDVPAEPTPAASLTAPVATTTRRKK